LIEAKKGRGGKKNRRYPVEKKKVFPPPPLAKSAERYGEKERGKIADFTNGFDMRKEEKRIDVGMRKNRPLPTNGKDALGRRREDKREEVIMAQWAVLRRLA